MIRTQLILRFFFDEKMLILVVYLNIDEFLTKNDKMTFFSLGECLSPFLLK